ncbi:conserved hypothetical protein [Histoplasma capsulatum var. duboisii H88]|uniref:Uncharacterized protein n=1 Tax=Ajellomyces capsulatus (strain H88) TaxID=544711 RepID=F0UBT6_AJEC8|nr:conserved hypothetical protein [Histoplasma capsulatum var. duboisii H88]
MPIKLPKGFARRKSSGNALEELDQAPQPSFKVFERPAPGRKSLDGSTTLNSIDGNSNSNSSRTKRSSEDPYANNLFANIDPPSSMENRYVEPGLPPTADPLRGGGTRVSKLTGFGGSRGTNNSASTGRLYDSSASSAKFSSSSTLPSSTDIPIQDVPVPPMHDSSFFSLRSSGRTFSFGNKSSSAKSLQRQDVVTPRSRGTVATRESAATASTTSTATPPRLPDTNLDMGDALSFGNMFDGLDREKENHKEQPAAPLLQSSLRRESASATPLIPTKGSQNHPPPLQFVSSKDVEPSPHTNDSQNSRDGLMSREEDDPILSRPPASRVRTSVLPSTNGSLSPTYNSGPSSRYYRSTVQLSRAADVEDEDAKIVNNSVSAQRRMTAEFSPDGDPPSSLPFSGSRWKQRNAAKQITRRPTPQDEDPHDDTHDDAHLVAALAAEASLAERYEENASNSEGHQPPKVMTPAQFERYRQQKEMTMKESNASSTRHSDDDDSDHYDEEEDEVEKAREAAKQRKKQEAHLSVYRQQMMKVTGEAAKLRNSEQNSVDNASPPGLLNNINRTSSFMAPEQPTTGKVSDGEDDDDIPLAILAAHGFPNKARPPGLLTPSISNPNLRASMQSFAASPPSVAAESPVATTPTARASLPVFARNLPRDPYNLGASLVNPSHRESLAMGGGTPSIFGAPPGLPPGGLVGVIANEERAKAMRRGSPNAPRGYDAPPGSLLAMNMNGLQNNILPLHQQQQQQQQFLNVPSAPPGQQPVVGQPDQVSQMTQMMQTQIQWMQSMMQMQGMQTPMNMGPGVHNAPPPSLPRPVSMFSNFNPSQPHLQGPPQVDHRTLSLLDPKWNNRQSAFFPNSPLGPEPGYAPSVAPSERSNIGTARRYRPVSTSQPPPHDKAMARSSTFTASTLRPWTEEQPWKISRTSTMNLNSDGNAIDMLRVGTEGLNVPGTSGSRPLSGLRVSTNMDMNINGGKGGDVHVIHRNTDDDDDDEEGAWAEMMKNREKKKSGWRFRKTMSAGLGDLFSHSHSHSPPL